MTSSLCQSFGLKVSQQFWIGYLGFRPSGSVLECPLGRDLYSMSPVLHYQLQPDGQSVPLFQVLRAGPRIPCLDPSLRF